MAGRIALDIRSWARAAVSPASWSPRRTAEKALVAVIQEACVHGVSTRAVDDLVKAMGAGGMSKSAVSRLCAEIDDRVNAFPERPLEGSIRMNSVHRTEFPTFRRKVGAVDGPASGSMPPASRSARAAFAIGLGPMAPRWLTVSRAVIVAVAVNEDGKREVLGVNAGPSEAETFWTDLPRAASPIAAFGA